MEITKTNQAPPYIRHGPVRRVKIEEPIRHKWVKRKT